VGEAAELPGSLFGLRWESEAATRLSSASGYPNFFPAAACESGAALRFAPQSKNRSVS
jgi:hypothetical protein